MPFSNKSTFFTASWSKYSKNLEYDILLEVDAAGLSGSGSAFAGLETERGPAAPNRVSPSEVEFNNDLLVDLKFEGVL